jgi:four helix bundle protein
MGLVDIARCLPVRDHRQLEVWRAAKALAVFTYRASNRLPEDERFGLVTQMRRAAISVPSNIAEGSARHSQRDFVRFLDIAAGSNSELMTQAEIVIDLELGPLEPFRSIVDQATSVRMMLAKLSSTIRKNATTTGRDSVGKR